jgi:tetratricopeptide (TPR) repeat protein
MKDHSRPRPRSAAWFAALVLLTFCFSIIATSAWAVNVRIKGKVVDGEGKAVPDVSVTLTGSRIKGKPLTGTSNKKGTFTFIVETGNFEMLLEKDGYLPQIIKLDARESGIKQVQVVLEAVEPVVAPAGDGTGLPEGLGTLTGDDAAQLKKGIKALDNGDIEAAAEIFTALTLSTPDKAEPWFYLGLARAEAGDHEAAAAGFRKAVELNPALGQAHFNLGRSLVELEDHDGAAAAFDQAVASGMDAANCYQLAANIYINRNDYGRIAHYLEKYCQAKPGDAEILFRLGSAYFNTGEMEKSVTALEGAIAADPEMVGAHYQLGMTYLNQGETDKAKAEFQTVVDKAPGSPLAAEAAGFLGALQ